MRTRGIECVLIATIVTSIGGAARAEEPAGTVAATTTTTAATTERSTSAAPSAATAAAAEARAKEIAAIRRAIASFGMIALLKASPRNAPAREATWGHADAPADPSAAARWRESIADGPVTLTDPRADDADARPVPMGAVATVGRGAGVADVDAFDRGAGKLTPIFQSHPPVRDPDSLALLQHRVPPEAIQRIVRANFGAFRVCYRSGLARDPTLAGRVVVRFSIGGDGAVALAVDAGSTLRDDDVVSCVVRGFLNLPFPATGGQPVTVLYPLTFSPPR